MFSMTGLNVRGVPTVQQGSESEMDIIILFIDSLSTRSWSGSCSIYIEANGTSN